MSQVRDIIISSKEPDLKNVGWISLDKKKKKFELKFFVNGKWLPILSDIETIEPEKIEEVKELIEWIDNNGTDFNNSKVNLITWNNDINPSNMDDFVVAGVYNIKGERTRMGDNLPIINTGNGHSFHARLTVLDSSILDNTNSDDKCITQVLSFSNRLGQGEVYIRTGKGNSLYNLAWEKWSTLQRNVNVDEVDSLDDLIDNGIYSGVWKQGRINPNYLAFVCIVINDYFIGTAPRRISQFVYGLNKSDGSVVYQSRVWDDSKGMWGDWEILNKNEINSMIKSSVDDAIKGVIDNAPEAYDSLRDIAEWINTHGEEATNLVLQLENEKETRKNADNAIKGMAVKTQFGTRKTDAEKVVIDYTSLDDKVSGEIHILAATNTTAGSMSAKDKSFIDSISQSEEVDNIDDAVLLIVGKSDGTFVRVSPNVLRGVTTQYLTKSDYANLEALGKIKDNVEYNIIENE